MTGLSQKQDEQLIQDLARWLSQRRLITPAILLLDVIKPVSFLAGQTLLLAEPLLGFLFDNSRIDAYADLLTEQSRVERLIARLTAEPEGNGPS